jgi:hypothetical protein
LPRYNTPPFLIDSRQNELAPSYLFILYLGVFLHTPCWVNPRSISLFSRTPLNPILSKVRDSSFLFDFTFISQIWKTLFSNSISIHWYLFFRCFSSNMFQLDFAFYYFHDEFPLNRWISSKFELFVPIVNTESLVSSSFLNYCLFRLTYVDETNPNFYSFRRGNLKKRDYFSVKIKPIIRFSSWIWYP